MISSLERGGPEAVGAPVRGVAVLAQDIGGLFPQLEGRLALRRRRGIAVRLARRAVSLATEIHSVIGDRPGVEQAWPLNVAALAARRRQADEADCVRALGRVAALGLQLPVLPEDQWQAEMIAFADEALLAELREACLDLAAAALGLADGS